MKNVLFTTRWSDFYRATVRPFPCDGPTSTRYTLHLLYTFTLALSTLTLFAQKDTTSYFAEVGGMAATSAYTPFWLRANQYGTVPFKNPFGFVKIGGQTTFGHNPHQPQLHLQGEAVLNLGGNDFRSPSNLVLPVAAATFRYRRFEAYVGRRKEFFGLGDTLLTSGSYSWSGNALPLPKLHVGTRGFVPIGFTKGLFAVHATFSHGWFGRQDSVQGAYLHQKTVFVRLGKPQWKAKFYLGMIHNVQWGGESEFVDQTLTQNGQFASSFTDYLYLMIAKTPKGNQYSFIDSLNQLGNHLGSVDLGIELTGKKWDVLLYHQHPYEDKSGLVFVNFPDGLYGLCFKNKNHSLISSFRLRQLTLEYLTTIDKGKNIREDLKNRYEADAYFYHSQYIDGWAYKQHIIGTPFITRYLDTHFDLTNQKPNQELLMINNNEVKVVYISLMGVFKSGIRVESRCSYSRNYGPFTNDNIKQVNQFSGIIRSYFPLNLLKGVELQTAISLDQGGLYNHSWGGMLSLSKMW